MTVKREDRDPGIALLRIEGHLMGGPENLAVIDAVHRALEEERPHIIVDLARVPWMSSGGVGILVRMHVTIKRSEGRLVLLNAPDRVKRVLAVTGLLAIIDSFDDEAEAIASFAGA